MTDEENIRRQYEMLRPALDERARRLFAASHVQILGRGGIAAGLGQFPRSAGVSR
jgi:hypothetical protein